MITVDHMRVELRPITPGDWRALHLWGGDERACRYQSWGPNTPDRSREFTAEAAAAWQATPIRRRVYVATVEGDVIGSGELRIHSERHRQGEIQYIVNPRWWGRGVATQVGRRLLHVAFIQLDLHRVFATCDPRNIGSQRVLTKLGMTVEGTLRHTMKLSDGWRDSTVCGVLRDEWPSGHDTE